MAFWGTGRPRIQLLREGSTSVQRTVNPPHPTGRSFGWRQEDDNRISPLNRKLIERRFGFRPYLRLIYRKIGSTDLEELLEVVNTSLLIRVIPHVDVDEIVFLAKVTDFVTEHLEDKVNYDSCTIEFTGIDIFPQIPNLDTLYTARLMGNSQAAAII